jgi:putative tricarboxylic transport membrane protein
MFEAIVAAVGRLSHFDVLAFIFLGTFIGLVFGAMPGVGGVTALVLMLPLTFGWDPATAMYFFAGIMGAVAFGGSIPAILLNTPGTAQSAASCLDGHPMAKKGEAGRALGISATASFLGATFGLVVLIILIPVMRQVVLMFGPPEFFLMVIWGLAAVAVAARGNMIKGLFAGGLGIAISLIGFSPVFGVLRYNFGSEYFFDGVPLVSFLLGIFAFSEVFHMLFTGGTIAKKKTTDKVTGVVGGMKEVFRYKVGLLRSSCIGVLIGIIPGVGGAVANFLSYVAAMQSSKHAETFGTGEPEGLIASEAANDAKDGGALLPTVAFGIPGSAEMAVLLGAFILHGLVPGPGLVMRHLDIIFALIFGLFVSNLLTSTLGLMGSRYLVRVTTVNVMYLIPMIVVISFIGCFAFRGNLWDIGLALVFGVIGYGARRFDYPRVCLVIGYILGEIAEKTFHQSLMMAYGDYRTFIGTPFRIALLMIVILTLAVPLITRRRQKKNFRSNA